MTEINKNNIVHSYKAYSEQIRSRSKLHYLVGLLVRWKQNFKYERAVRIARKNGATIGEGVIMPLKLARKANSNLIIGDHVSIQTDKIDLRSPVHIGNYVIIGSETEIITTSHNINIPTFDVKHYGITIEDYVWLPTKILVLPSCRKIEFGAVVGSGSVVVKNVPCMSVVSGNPSTVIKKREIVHSSLVVEKLLGGDFSLYKKCRKYDFT